MTSHSRPQAPGPVVVIRGLGGYWPGCETFCGRVRGYGEQVLNCTCTQARRRAEEIASGMQSGRWSRLRIVGYSYGADTAIKLARDVQRYGISVERLILIEATNPGTVPGNVRYYFNIYESRPRTDWLPVLRGVVVCCDSESTYMINHDIRQQQTRLRRLNHLYFATVPQLQTLAACQAGAPWQSETETVAETQETSKKTSGSAAVSSTQNVSKAVSSSPTETQE